MASTLYPAGSDLSAELVLNKIMNNQVKTATGKTVTAAGRSMAAELANVGYMAGAAAGNVASGQGYVLAAQTQVTEMVSKLQEMQKVIGGVVGTKSAYKSAASTAGELFAMLGKLETATLNGKSLLSGTGITLNAGMGVSITVINKTVSTGAGKLQALKAKLGTGTITSQATAASALTAIDEAIKELNGYIADYGISYNQLRDRVAVLNDLGQSFNEAAAGQSITAGGGASSLLAAMLGSNTSA